MSFLLLHFQWSLKRSRATRVATKTERSVSLKFGWYNGRIKLCE
jgi:hypothetical protein